MVALREDDVAAEAIGIDTARTKLLAFTLAGALAGLAGVFYAHNNQFVSYQTFTTDESFILLAMLVIGGIGTMPGPIIGVALLLALPEALRGAALYRYLLYGLALAVVAPQWPAGIAGIFFRIRRREGKGKAALGRPGGEAA
jgi:branched-chain amino acid transport system permease protein